MMRCSGFFLREWNFVYVELSSCDNQHRIVSVYMMEIIMPFTNQLNEIFFYYDDEE